MFVTPRIRLTIIEKTLSVDIKHVFYYLTYVYYYLF